MGHSRCRRCTLWPYHQGVALVITKQLREGWPAWPARTQPDAHHDQRTCQYQSGTPPKGPLEKIGNKHRHHEQHGRQNFQACDLRLLHRTLNCAYTSASTATTRAAPSTNTTASFSQTLPFFRQRAIAVSIMHPIGLLYLAPGGCRRPATGFPR